MTKNLIAAKAWKNGREKICKICKWFVSGFNNDRKYEWEKCTRSSDASDEPDKWQDNNCSHFEPKDEREKAK